MTESFILARTSVHRRRVMLNGSFLAPCRTGNSNLFAFPVLVLL